MLSWSNFNIAHYLASFIQEQRAKGNKIWFLPFTYGADFTPLAGSTTDSRTIDIQEDSDFFVTETSCNDLLTDLLCRMRLESSGRELQNTPIQVGNIFGSGSEPSYWYKPLFLQRRTSLFLEVTNGSGTDKTLRFAFRGVKVFITPMAHHAAA